MNDPITPKEELKKIQKKSLIGKLEKTCRNRELFLSCMHGTKKLRSFLDEGDDPNTRMEYGDFTLLIIASMIGNICSAKTLLEYNIRINDKDRYNMTALLWTCLYGRKRLVKLLIENGADIYVTNKKGTTPLMMASFSGSSDTVKYLLGVVDINEVDERGLNALMYAEDNKVIYSLLKIGLSPYKKNDYGDNFLGTLECEIKREKYIKFYEENKCTSIKPSYQKR